MRKRAKLEEASTAYHQEPTAYHTKTGNKIRLESNYQITI